MHKVKSMPIFRKNSSSPIKHISIGMNIQNCRIWDSENSHAIHEKQMNPQLATV